MISQALAATIGAAVLVSAPMSASAGTRQAWAIDGDTIALRNGASVRVIGIDTPERGQCGYDTAKRATARFVDDGVRLKRSATTDNTDHYGRILRYVRADGRDLGLFLINRGLAVARYDSKDGYGWHTKQRAYHRADDGTRNVCGWDPTKKVTQPNGGKAFPNCDAAREAGKAPLYRGDRGYGSHLDGDGDGIACE